MAAQLSLQKSKYHDHNGEPGCQGLEELNRMFRNFWDPTAYWVCEKQGAKARLHHCKQSQLYSEEFGRCVHYSEWNWTEPNEPPSRPKC